MSPSLALMPTVVVLLGLGRGVYDIKESIYLTVEHVLQVFNVTHSLVSRRLLMKRGLSCLCLVLECMSNV